MALDIFERKSDMNESEQYRLLGKLRSSHECLVAKWLNITLANIKMSKDMILNVTVTERFRLQELAVVNLYVK